MHLLDIFDIYIYISLSIYSNSLIKKIYIYICLYQVFFTVYILHFDQLFYPQGKSNIITSAIDKKLRIKKLPNQMKVTIAVT